MSSILVTGGAGFIGSHVTKKLLEQGHQVHIIDDFNPRYNPALKEARLAHMFSDSPAQPILSRVDIRDLTALKPIFAAGKFDHVIHLAAWASVLASMENPHIYSEVNVDGTVNILELSRQHNVKNLVFASTSSVYGGKKEMPLKESDSIIRPISPYAASKVSGEVMCAAWHAMYKLPITCLRFFTVYGPWGRPDMAMFQFTESILKGEPINMRGANTKRDFTYVDDIVDGIVKSMNQSAGFQTYNLGEQDAVPLPRMIKALETALNKSANIIEVPLPAGEATETMADISAAKTELGYEPKTSIEAGAKLFADWYLNWYKPNFHA